MQSRTLLEEQFPVALLSKESYKERKAGSVQTLTGLGKWWGRKPLVLVRSLILAALIPASGDPEADREVLLALMTMDADGLRRRRRGKFAAKELARLLDDAERERLFFDPAKGLFRPEITPEVRAAADLAAFDALPYDQKLVQCLRPEEIDGPSPERWAFINAHLGTSASSIPELVDELARRRFGHPLRVGDAFAGGGSIPFEAARIGAEAYAGDLNPVAVLLTWAALHIAGADEATAERIRLSQERLLAELRAFVDQHNLETNAEGWRAEAYLYCNEVVDPRSKWQVPLAPSWIVSEKEGVYAELVPDPAGERFEIAIRTGGSKADLAAAKAEATWSGGLRSPVDEHGQRIEPQHRHPFSGNSLRGADGLRRWENDDLVPRPDDVFQERLFAIRWRTPDGKRVYRAPDAADLAREARVLELLRTHFADWQAQGFIPSAAIVPGYNTAQPIRERGWTRWHHLFAPRQLLLHGYLSSRLVGLTGEELAAGVLLVGKMTNFSSRLTSWHQGNAQSTNTFANQALNTTVVYPCMPTSMCSSQILYSEGGKTRLRSTVNAVDARAFPYDVDLFITDPPYADMVNYEELTEFFTAWYAGHKDALAALIPGWGPDTLRELAIKGTGESFRRSIASAYRRLCEKMDDDGVHVVMFTSQDIKVWRDLAVILWSAGLRITAVWTIATETTSGLKQGSYVQGTVCLVLRKRTGGEKGYLSEIQPDIEQEVRHQVAWMREHDDLATPNFADADLQIAAYGAALKILTGYSDIPGIDLEAIVEGRFEGSGVERLDSILDNARNMASEELVPRELDVTAWKASESIERFYLKCLEMESAGEGKIGAFEAMAQAFMADGWREMFSSLSANEARLGTPDGLDEQIMRNHPFAETPLRRLLYAVKLTQETRDGKAGREWLRDDLLERYPAERDRLRAILRYFIRIADRPSMDHWKSALEAARKLEGAIAADQL